MFQKIHAIFTPPPVLYPCRDRVCRDWRTLVLTVKFPLKTKKKKKTKRYRTVAAVTPYNIFSLLTPYTYRPRAVYKFKYNLIWLIRQQELFICIIIQSVYVFAASERAIGLRRKSFPQVVHNCESKNRLQRCCALQYALLTYT